MPASSFTWITGTTGDWAVASDWTTGTIPASGADILIGSGGAVGFVSLIGTADTEIVNVLTLGGFSGANPTLEVAGTLQFSGASPGITFVQGKILVDSTGLLEGSASALSYPFGVDFINNGTVRANGGAGAALQISSRFTNNATVLADNGILALGGFSLANLSGTTLTGGTYIAQGPDFGTFNEIEIGLGNYTAIIATDAANIVLSGGASDIVGYNGGFQTIEQQLQTIASTGTLQLLAHRGYATSNTLTDAGVLLLQGGTLAPSGLNVVAGGTLEGYGIIASAVTNAGTVIANGGTNGALDLSLGIGGAGALSVTTSSALILAGDSPSAIVNNGTIYDTSGLLLVSSLTGAGTLVVQNGGTIELSGGASQNIGFSGTAATLRLDAPSLYTGTIAGFGKGDSLILAGVTASSATVVNGNTLTVINAGTTVDHYTLSGSYTGATFSTVQSGSTLTIQNTAGAPARSDFQFSVLLSDTAGLSAAQETQIVNNLSAAAADWAQYVTGHAPLRIQLNITSVAGKGTELANAGYTTTVPTGQVISGETVVTPSSVYALTTGNYAPGSASDIIVNLPLAAGELGSSGGLYVNPSPFTGNGSVPADEYDLLTVFRHEMAHGLGFAGLTNASTFSLGANETLFDADIQYTFVNGSTITDAKFIGPNAEAAYGAFLGTNTATPIPLTLLNNGEALFHVANTSGEPLGTDLMNGVGLTSGTVRDISSVDLAMLRDIGLPVTAGLVCFARGTRIATPAGQVAVETLKPGGLVTTWSGAARPIVWIGTGAVLATRGQRTAATPIVLRKGALADNVPSYDLRVTKGHAFLVDGVLIPAEFLVNHRSIVWDDRAQDVTLYHIELETHDILIANGAPAESYRDDGNRWLFGNANTGWGQPEKPPYAPVLTGGPLVDAAWRRLLDRAGPRPGLPLTDDPDLALHVGGRRLNPVSRSGGIVLFRPNTPTEAVRIVSRAASPQELGLARDPRVLGVAVRRIVCRQRAHLRLIGAHDPALHDGFHDFEPNQEHRWTNGDARLPAELFRGLRGIVELEVHVAGRTRYLADDRPLGGREAIETHCCHSMTEA